MRCWLPVRRMNVGLDHALSLSFRACAAEHGLTGGQVQRLCKGTRPAGRLSGLAGVFPLSSFLIYAG